MKSGSHPRGTYAQIFSSSDFQCMVPLPQDHGGGGGGGGVKIYNGSPRNHTKM